MISNEDMVIPIIYVASPEEAKIIREQYKAKKQKVYIMISGEQDIKNVLTDFLRARIS